MARYARPIVILFLSVWGAQALADDSLSVQTVEAPELHSTGMVERLQVDEAFLDGGDLSGVLRGQMGLTVRQQAGVGQPAYVLIRGGNPRQLAVSLDGAQLRVPYGVGFDFGGMALAGIAAADVYRGPAALARGSGALTGAIDLRTQSVRGRGWQGSAGLLTGSFGTYGLMANGQWANQQTQASVGVQGRVSQGDYDFVDAQGVEHTRVNNDHQQIGVLGAVQHRFSAQNSVKATVAHQAGERGSAGPAEFQESFRDARTEDDFTIGILSASQKSAAKLSGADVDFVEHLDLQSRNVEYTNPQAFQGGGELQTSGRYIGVSGVLGMVVFGGTKQVPVIVDLRGSLRQESFRGTQRGEILDDFETSRRTVDWILSPEIRMFEDRLVVFQTTRLEITHGYTERLALLPGLGARGLITPWLSVSSNIARTGRTPDFDELYLNLEALRGNPNLKPERAVVWDANVRLGQSDAWHLEVGYFQNDVSNTILFLPVSSAVTQAMNVVPGVVRGVEAKAGWQPISLVELGLSGTWTRARMTETNAQLVHQPEWSGVASLGLDLSTLVPLEELRLGTSVFGRSQTNLDVFGNLKSPGTLRWDADFRVSPWKFVGFRVSGTNLTDERGTVDTLQQPLPGRAVYGAIEVRTDGL